LYGFGKPTIIVLKKDERPKLKIPSDIRGIEQIRYDTFDELTDSLKKAITSFFDMRAKTTEDLIDMQRLLEYFISILTLEIDTRKLCESGLKSKIINYTRDRGRIIIDKGSSDGIKNSMVFNVIRFDKNLGGTPLENDEGSIIIKHVQDKIAQCQPLRIDPYNKFWKNVAHGKVAGNVVKPISNECFRNDLTDDLEDLLSKLKIMKDGIYFSRVH